MLVTALLFGATIAPAYGQGMGDFYKPNEPEQGSDADIGITVTLGEEDTNRFSGLSEYEVDDFKLTVKPGTQAAMELCPDALNPNTDCTFILDNAEFRENSAEYAWVLEGLLRIQKESGQSTATNNYELWGSLNRISENKMGDLTMEQVEGDIKIDRTQAAINFDPDFRFGTVGVVRIGELDCDTIEEAGARSTCEETMEGNGEALLFGVLY